MLWWKRIQWHLAQERRPSRQLNGTILLTQNHQHFRLVLVRTRSGFLLGAIHRETQQLEERHTQTANHLHNQLIATFKLEQSTEKGNKLRTVLVHQHSQVTRLFWSCILDDEFTTLFKVCYVHGTRVTKETNRFN